MILEALISEEGIVREVGRPEPMFEQAAIAAVRQWRFSPTLLNEGRSYRDDGHGRVHVDVRLSALGRALDWGPEDGRPETRVTMRREGFFMGIRLVAMTLGSCGHCAVPPRASLLFCGIRLQPAGEGHRCRHQVEWQNPHLVLRGCEGQSGKADQLGILWCPSRRAATSRHQQELAQGWRYGRRRGLPRAGWIE